MAKTVFITGASAGIGESLANELAARGYNLALAARRFSKLEALREDIHAKHPHVHVEIDELDVSDTDRVFEVTNRFFSTPQGVDIVVANAGIAAATPVGSGHFKEDAQVIRTNVIGAMATVDAAVACFRRIGKGHVVAVSSVAAFRGLPNTAAYCASKAAISTYMDALVTECLGTGIKVTTLHPGFIDTDINRKMKSRPFLIDVEKGARLVADAIEHQVEQSTIPVFPWSVVKTLMRVAPRRMMSSQSTKDK